jgi:uncharacterized membrane protein YfcA
MNPISILFFIFGICLLLVGLYMFTGHKLEMVAWRAAYKGLKKEGWKNIGKWTMISSIIPFIIAIIFMFVGD